MAAGATAMAATRARRRLVVLPCLRASGAEHMSLDERLLDEAPGPVARRYEWDPPAVSLGKFQRLPGESAGEAGDRAVLHGAGFEWSFAVVIPLRFVGPPSAGSASTTASSTTAGPPRMAFPGSAYDLVADAFAAALARCGVALDAVRETPYQRSGLCFASALRHDLLAGGEKVVAVAQARRGANVLVHGSVLERRPPRALIAELERLVGEPWRGEGLAGTGSRVDGDALWRDVLSYLAAALDVGARRPAPLGEARQEALHRRVSLP